MSFNAYAAFRGPITLPIQGKNYTLPEVPADLGLKLTLIAERSAEILRIAAANEQAAAEAREAGKPEPTPQELPSFEVEGIDAPEDMNRALLGDVYDQMVADGVPFEALNLAGMTASHDFLYGREAAEAFWNSGGDPKAVAQTLPGANIFSASTDEASTTKPPASTSGTKPRKKK